MKKHFLSILAITMMIATTIQAQTPTKGLVAYYPFSGNANDGSGNGNNGTVNGATLTTDRFGKANSAYSFNGSSDNISIGNFSNWNMYKSNFTMSVWFETNDTNHTREQMLIGKDSACSGPGQFRFEINEGGGSSPKNNISVVATGLTGVNQFRYFPLPYKKVWVNAIIVKSDKNSFIYVGGNLVATYPNDTTVAVGAINFNCYIGARLATPSCATKGNLANFFWGNLDDIRIYNRALDSTEVSSIYHEGGYDLPKTTIPTNGLVAWYPFTGNAIDSSGNGNNGTVNGATLSTDRFGKANCAYSFNGSSDNILIGNFSNWNIYKSNFTMSVWFETNDTTHTREQMLIGKDSACSGPGQFRFEINEGGGSSPKNNISVVATGLTGVNQFRYFPLPNKKVWVHAIIVKSDKNSFIYFNGNLVATYPNDTSVAVGAINFNCYIGARLATPSCATKGNLANFFWGTLDDIRVYNRALDSTEVQALYNEGGYGNTLPLTITKISAINNVGKVAISWATANELNTNLFAIQHSVDGINFTTINTLNAKGSGTNGYSFIDNTPTNGINYYRLESIDKDGSISYSKVVSVQLSLINSQLSIFPNPAKDRATISFGKLIDKATIAVYDITGKAIITQQINNSTSTYQLNTQKLTKGIYIVKVKTGTSSVNGKLVIER